MSAARTQDNVLPLTPVLPLDAAELDHHLSAGFAGPHASGSPYDGDHAPEALFISALVDSGVYLPMAWDVEDEMFEGYSSVHQWCSRYAEASGKAPTAQHLQLAHPTFPYMPGCSVTYAVKELLTDYASRTLRRGMSTAASHLRVDDIEKATEALHAAINTVNASGPADYGTLDDFRKDEIDVPGVPVPAGHQSRLLGEHRPGHLWTVAARPNVGKSYHLAHRAVLALEGGWDVDFYSLEMPRAEVLERLACIAVAHRFPGRTWGELDHDEVEAAWDAWKISHGRRLRVFTKGSFSPARIEAKTQAHTLVIIDYVNLLHSNDGQRASMGYNVLETITADVKAMCLNAEVPVLIAAQINRSGAGDGAASLEHIAGADSIGRDSDVVMIMRDHVGDTRKWLLPKNRHGRKNQTWHSAFHPDTADFSDLSYEEALERAALPMQVELD